MGLWSASPRTSEITPTETAAAYQPTKKIDMSESTRTTATTSFMTRRTLKRAAGFAMRGRTRYAAIS